MLAGLMPASSNRTGSVDSPASGDSSLPAATAAPIAPAGEPARARATLVIEAGRFERHYWADLWRYRELFYFLAWRDILVRYKQTTIGVLWAVLRPLLTMLIFWGVFGAVGHFPSSGVPYPIAVFAALLPWQLFAGALSDAGSSLVNNSHMITKVYFPRIVLPASTIAVSLVDFALSALLLTLLMVGYGYWPDWRALTLPLFLVVALAAALGPALWFAALTVRYRDFRYVVPFVVQLGLYLSPVGFTSDVVLLYSINPMVGVIDGFRWSLLGGRAALYWPGFVLSLVLVTALLVSGIVYFRRTEKTFADVV
jgi:lipopolysaccharide transport system permease protein